MIAIFVPIVIISVLSLLIWFWSTSKPIQFVDNNGNIMPKSISEKVFVDINGTKQGMFIKGHDTTKPVLLYVHGGLPFSFLTQEYPTGLESDFVLVWWEQRGFGLSYNPNTSYSEINSDTLVSDLFAVTNYLCQRFKQKKIYLMGHSGGSFIGIKAAALAPELFHAYIGLAQISNQRKSEKIAYDYMLEQFRENGNKRMLKKLKLAPVTMTSIPKEYLAIRDEAMHSLGIGTMHKMNSVIWGIFLPSLRFREYSFMEKINLWRAKAKYGVSVTWDEILSTDLSNEVTKFALPIYFLEGIYDYTCSFSEARAYFDVIEAPLKGFYTFYNSAHSPIFEEPEKAQLIFRNDILNGLTTSADNANDKSPR